jgi:type I restriction enzyme S subunit
MGSRLRIGDLCTFQNGGTPSKGDPAFWNGTIPWISSADIFDGVVQPPRHFITEAAVISSAVNVVEAGTVLVVTRVGVGKVAIAPTRLAFSQDITALRFGKRIDPGYISKFLASKATHMNTLARGATIKGITREVVADLELDLPSLAEQQRIAAILDKADEIRKKRELVISKLDQLAQSVFVEMFGDPFTNPRKFPPRTLGELIKFEGGSQPPASTFTSEPSPDRVRLVQIRDFKTDKFITYIPKALSKRSFEPDDVMIGRYGPPVFQILRGLSGSYNVALMKAAPRDGALKDFIYYLLKERRLNSFVVSNSERTAGQSGVNLQLLESLSAYLPPMELQRKFSGIVHKLRNISIGAAASSEKTFAFQRSLQHSCFQQT